MLAEIARKQEERERARAEEARRAAEAQPPAAADADRGASSVDKFSTLKSP
ncbi:MAG TPA: hypothetical protein VMG33_02195 [Steroidobacteraceae bacterium]|nr:hypothetical protein [Steroidobacteraceae bacterium]